MRLSNVIGIVMLALGLAFSMSAGTAAAEELAVGKVKTLSGEAMIVRGEQQIPAVLGMGIEVGDVIQTGEGAALGVLFNDDTRISLSANSELTVDEYVYDAKSETGSFLSKLARGTMAFLTGKLGKTSAENVKVKTPLATIGIRGTEFIVQVAS